MFCEVTEDLGDTPQPTTEPRRLPLGERPSASPSPKRCSFASTAASSSSDDSPMTLPLLELLNPVEPSALPLVRLLGLGNLGSTHNEFALFRTVLASPLSC